MTIVRLEHDNELRYSLEQCEGAIVNLEHGNWIMVVSRVMQKLDNLFSESSMIVLIERFPLSLE